MPNFKNRTRFFQTCLGVFQGGGCRAAAFAGAMVEAEGRYVDFAGVAGTSAGSIVAALLGAGSTADFLEKSLQDLNFLDLLADPEPDSLTPTGTMGRIGFWIACAIGKQDVAKVVRFHGLYSSKAIEEWMNQRLHELLPHVKGRVRFRDLPVPTYIVAADILTNDAKVWSSPTTQDDEVAFAVRCSCSIPGFFQPVHGRYIDGGILSNLPTFVFSGPEFAQNKPFANRILAFTLLAAHEDKAPRTAKELFHATVSTIVDGSSTLQGRLVRSVHEIPIDTGEIQATDFTDMNTENISWLVKQGRDSTKAFFDDELGRVKAAEQNTNLLRGDDEIYSALTEELDEIHIREIVISDDRTGWVYALFPALLAWRTRGTRIQVVLNPSESVTGHELYRRRVLRALGAEIYASRSISFRGFLFNPADEALGCAVVVVPESFGTEDVAVRYRAPFDFPAIQALWNSIKPLIQADPLKLNITPRICGVSENLILEKLRRHVKPYAMQGTRLSMETIPLDSIMLLSRFVRGFKFKQIQQLFDLFEREGLRYFEAAEVRYTDQLATLVTPPVVEYTGGRHILVQGNTRALYCHKSDIKEIRCVVVQDHSTPLPSNQRIELRDVLIGGRTISTADRYGGDIDKDYRNIEWATHIPDETLLDARL